MRSVDLRSDTVTRPSAAMREAMATAEVGDDVYGEDPTVNRLQERVAGLLGMGAGLFVPSGVMANQLALAVHAAPGDEVIVEETSHIYNYESGAPALLSGLQLRPLAGDRGRLSPGQVAAAVRPVADVAPRTRLVCAENTANKAGGVAWSPERLEAVAEAARSRGLAAHLDGARLWNAAETTDTAPATLAAPFDTAWVALSKGLGAPVGSVLCGPSDTITQARRRRKAFGGGMRQAGVLAAAGLHAVEHHRAGLSEDHAQAGRLARTLAELPPFEIDPQAVDTNIVIFEVAGGGHAPSDAASVVETLEEDGVLMTVFGPRTVRATTHRDVSEADLDHAVTVLEEHFG
ncbi:MAG: low specificity L-threonine aldolase [Bacteroidetes bacterium QS_9_68_14]|nr:MAG: low specificity L-threonine aldolase [Bacteroidetes bacterium QS_9_68_14]